jgi:hypothetical protein
MFRIEPSYCSKHPVSRAFRYGVTFGYGPELTKLPDSTVETVQKAGVLSDRPVVVAGSSG